jgi:hypothetical protein
MLPIRITDVSSETLVESTPAQHRQKITIAAIGCQSRDEPTQASDGSGNSVTRYLRRSSLLPALFTT